MRLPSQIPAALWAIALALPACSPQPEPLEVVIALDRSVAAPATLTLAVDYSRSGARPARVDGRPLCASVLPHGSVSFSDDGAGNLSIRISSERVLTAPMDVAVCRMVAGKSSATRASVAQGLAISIHGREESSRQGGGRQSAERRHSQKPRRRPAPAAGADVKSAPVAPSAGGNVSRGSATDSQTARQPLPEMGKSEARPGGQITPGAGQSPPPGSVPASGPESKSKAAPGRPGKGRLPGTVATAPKDPATDQSTGSERKDAAENPALPYAVTVSVTTTSGSLGALQFDVIHLGDSGNFVGKADSVDCSPQVEAALATGNNRRAGRLVFALVDVGGFETPSPIVTCTFKTRESLDPNSFDVYVVTATDTNGVPVMTDMTVSSVEPLY